jgi:hypothetical protein
MIFNKGDIVVCVDNNNGKYRITIGKQYEVLYDVDYQNDLLHVAFDTPGIGKENGGFNSDRFMKLEDWRESQIDKILE